MTVSRTHLGQFTLRRGAGCISQVELEHGSCKRLSHKKEGATQPGAVPRGAMEETNLEKYGSYQEALEKSGNQRSEDGGESGPSLMNCLPQMMYGFGDDPAPLPESVYFMQQLVGEYVHHVTDEACKLAESKGKLDTECFLYAVRGDKAKYKRANEVLELHAHMRNSTRQRFTDQEMPVYFPSFPKRPAVRAVASLSGLTVEEELSPPLSSASSSPSPSPSPSSSPQACPASPIPVPSSEPSGGPASSSPADPVDDEKR